MSLTEGSILQNANNVILNNPQLISAHNFNQYNVNDGIDKQHWLQKLEGYVFSGALLNSAERYDPPKCHPKTRVKVLEKIEKWAKNERPSVSVSWLSGAAGAGKSAIAQTIGERLRGQGVLVASFFFSRTIAGRNEKKFLIPTLAYQLTVSGPFPIATDAILTSISKDPKVFEKSLEIQVKALIIEPLLALHEQGGFPPLTIIIDGLDECWQDYPNQDHEKQQQEILEAISTAAKHDLPLRFLIASRPERQIRESFRQPSLRLMTSHTILDNTLNPNADIERYLRSQFDELRKRNAFLRPSWPSEETILHLVEKSSGHFVYASTVMRYISHPRANPERSLDNVLKLKTTDEQSRRPFAELDALYLHIMESIFTPSLPAVLDMLGLLWHPGFVDKDAFVGVMTRSPEFMAKMLFSTTEQIYTDLIDLHSILEIPPITASKTTPIFVIHASFSEFLLQPERSGRFHINGNQVHSRCQFNLMKHAIIANSLHPSSSDYRWKNIQHMFLVGMQRTPFNEPCPPSVDLKDGLEAMISRRSSKYFGYLEKIGMNHLGKPRRQYFRLYLDWEELIKMLLYLRVGGIEQTPLSHTNLPSLPLARGATVNSWFHSFHKD